MNYLITGGTGLIGTKFIKSLPPNDNVVVLSRQNQAEVVVQLGRAVSVIHDLNDLPENAEPDIVLNLAGEPIADKAWTEKQKQRIRASRIELTKRLATILKARNIQPKLVLSGSAVGFYAQQNGNPIVENSAAGTDFSAELCKDWELAAKNITCDRLIHLRTGLVLDKGKGLLGSLEPSFKFGGGAVLGSGKHHMPWIHVSDYVRALHFIIDNKNLAGPVNMSAPSPASNKDFSKALAHAMNRPMFMKMPEFVLSLIFGERKELLLADLNVLPEKLTSFGFEFKFSELNKALSDIYSS